MSKERSTSEEFDEAIERLLRRFRGRIDPGVVAERLVAAAEAISTSPEDAGVSFDPLTSTLHVVFDDASELEDKLSDFCELRALVVDAEIPMHQDVVVRVSGSGSAVELMGRVVQELPAGKCVQIDRLDRITETQLRALPEKMRDAPGPSADVFERPHTGRRAPIDTPVPPTEAARAEPIRSSSNGFERQPTLAQHRPSVSPSRTWTTTETPLDQVLLLLVANNATGLIELVGDPRRLVLIDRGSFVDVGTDPESPDESLESLLKGASTIDADDVDKVRSYREQFGVGSSEALLNLGVIDWNELQIGLRTRVRYLLRNVWEFDGEIRFFPLEELPSKPMAKPVRILNFVFGHRAELFAETSEPPESIENFLLKPPDTLPPSLATVELLPQHDDILSIRFANGRRVGELLRLARSEKSEALAAVETLVHLGFLEKTRLRPISRVFTQSVRQVDILYARLSSESHFEVFGLHWSAYDAEIEQRYKELKAKFDPEQFDEILDDELAERLQAVNDRVDEAWKVLRNRRRRVAHRAEIVDEFQIENSVQMFESQADTALFRHESGEAVGFLSRVLELQPHRRDIEAKLRRVEELK